MPGPFTFTQRAFLAAVYAGVIAVRTDISAEILLTVIGSIAVLLALYTVLCTPAVVFLAQAELGESGKNEIA